jgi:hypothetical protein
MLTLGSHVPLLDVNDALLIVTPADGVTDRITSLAVVVGLLFVTVTV